MIWHDGPVEGCLIRQLNQFSDERGWLSEIFRRDELPDPLHPVMGYVSMTKPGVARGPHEHRDQTDLFAFFNGSFRLYLWDGRDGSPTHGNRQMLDVGRENPVTVCIPPGVIHAYRNIGTADALVINCPNRLYAGPGKTEAVDEIRWEDRTEHQLIMD